MEEVGFVSLIFTNQKSTLEIVNMIISRAIRVQKGKVSKVFPAPPSLKNQNNREKQVYLIPRCCWMGSMTQSVPSMCSRRSKGPVGMCSS